MEITSHFIGIRLKNRTFIDLFVALQAYLEKNNITDSIELQDNHSLHVTLYYFPSKLISEELSAIKNDLHDLNQDNKDYRLSVKKSSYFKQKEKEFICYFDPSPATNLVVWNTCLRKQYKKALIPDNQYAYIPHISIYNILNHEVFLKHKTSIEEIMIQFLSRMDNENLYWGFFLFAVNAKIHPEMQIIVDLL